MNRYTKVLSFIMVIIPVSIALFSSAFIFSKIDKSNIELKDNFNKNNINYNLEVKEKFPTRNEKILIHRIANGIALRKLKTGWYRCGKRQTEWETYEYSRKIANSIVISSIKYKLNPWGILGCAEHESRLDECALGKKPREWGYRHGILQRNRRSLSHKKADVIKMLKSKLWRNTNYSADLGLLQLLDKFYDGDVEDMLTIGKGIDIASNAMKRRAKQYKKISTAKFYYRPWRRWKMAIKELNWYDRKVTKYAIAFGARHNEI